VLIRNFKHIVSFIFINEFLHCILHKLIERRFIVENEMEEGELEMDEDNDGDGENEEG
jgi:hypothetical protein